MSLVDAFAEELKSKLLANPHSSTAAAPSISQQIVESTRCKVLRLFNADPKHFEVVFVANATAGIKLVCEAFAGHDNGFEYVYHRDSHTSLIGVRELAKRSRCLQSEKEVERWLNEPRKNSKTPELFAYPAQSNMNGRRLPLCWAGAVRVSSQRSNTYSLLDVAAFVSTTPVDLSDHMQAPDFTVLSFYKIFGFPNLGALLVRKSVAHVFDRRQYFGGGTTEMITCTGIPWAARKENSLHERLEDGTGATHSILALNCAIDIHGRIFESFEQVSAHTGWLAKCLYEKLGKMRYTNGKEMCKIYKDSRSNYGNAATQGATVAFNVRYYDGAWMGSWRIGRLAAERGIHVRTGSLCNPAGMAHALGLTAADVQKAYHEGFRCGQEHDVRQGVPFGMVRVSFGAMSTLGDVDTFLRFLEEVCVEHDHEVGGTKSYGKQREDENNSRTYVEDKVISRSSTVGRRGKQTVEKKKRSGKIWRIALPSLGNL